MNTIKIDKNKVKMIAHRGLSGLETENTAAAFVAAGNRSYFGIETDVHVTKDNKIAVIHDVQTNRVSGIDMNVEESSLEELQSIPLYNKGAYNKEVGHYRTDLRIPSLSDYISICERYEKKAVLELKNRMSLDSVAQIITIIKEFDYLENVIFISFKWDNLMHVRELLPEQKVQYLISECDDALVEKLIQERVDLDILSPSVTKELVDILHKNHLEINCWVVDDAAEAAKLIDLGVDYITSNILE